MSEDAKTECFVIVDEINRIASEAYLDITTDEPVEMVYHPKRFMWVYVGGKLMFRIYQHNGNFAVAQFAPRKVDDSEAIAPAKLAAGSRRKHRGRKRANRQNLQDYDGSAVP